MAIDKSVFSRSQFRFAIAEESVFGTGIDTQANFKELEVLNDPWPDFSGVVRDVRKRADGKMVYSHTDIYLDEEGGADGFPITLECIATDITADLLMYGVMQDQAAAEGGTTPYIKTFEWDGSTDGDNSGTPYKIYSLIGYNPATAESFAMKTCVVKTLVLNSDPGSNGGRATMTATFWTGFKPVIGANTIGGSPTAIAPASWGATPGTDYYVHQLLNTKTIDSADLVVGNFSFTWETNVKRLGFDTSGNPEQYHFSQFDFSGEVTAKYDVNTQDIRDKFILNPEAGSAECTVIMQWGDGSADGTFKIDSNAVLSSHPSLSHPEEGTMVTIPLQGVDDGTNEAVEVTIANAVDRTW